MKREERKGIAQRTLDALAEGSYVNQAGQSVDIRAAQHAAEQASTIIWPDTALAANRSASQQPRISVCAATTLATAQTHAQTGQRVAILNFASAKNPGGGFLGGSQAQEESIARSSGLYPCLTRCSEFYRFHKQQNNLLYSDALIWSPQVPVLCDDAGNWLDQPYLVDVITVAAVNAGAIRQNRTGQSSEVEPAMHQRMQRLLAFCATQPIERLILGAWGCGVFGNDPTMIASLFKQVIGQQAWPFTQIDFAIYDPSPRRTTVALFVDIFKD
ncbi:TIGR02452 family protein [Herpetosiphon gulosus]|uniref:Microbial-type PARG catalytic domain-containing protein n=1 Tax=Herpetosiphon gulosus TaxID=1973496 RepID=A0ABP9WV45_9CHLR